MIYEGHGCSVVQFEGVSDGSEFQDVDVKGFHWLCVVLRVNTPPQPERLAYDEMTSQFWMEHKIFLWGCGFLSTTITKILVPSMVEEKHGHFFRKFSWKACMWNWAKDTTYMEGHAHPGCISGELLVTIQSLQCFSKVINTWYCVKLNVTTNKTMD